MLVVLLLISTQTFAEIYDHNKYFDVEDRMKADCIVSSLMSMYNYLGDKSHDRQGLRCAVWNDVYESSENSLTIRLQVHPGERVLHSKCRSLSLSGGNPVSSGKSGPWCYVHSQQDPKKFIPSQCFENCTGNPRPKLRKRVSTYGKVLSESNYNYALLDNIDKYFKKYRWGDDKYYKEKPSDTVYTEEYYRIRQQIFFGCLGALGLITIWILSCYAVKKKAMSSRRRRDIALQEMFKEEHAKIPEVISRPAPN